MKRSEFVSGEIHPSKSSMSFILDSLDSSDSSDSLIGLVCFGLTSFWRETKDPEGVKQDSPGREPWVQGPDCGKP